MLRCRYIYGVILLAGVTAAMAWAQIPRAAQTSGSKAPIPASDVEPVERLKSARREYQVSLEQLRAHYLSVSDTERAKLVEAELINFHRHSREPYNLLLEVPPPTLQALYNIPEANELYMRGIAFKDRAKKGGSGELDDYIRAELLFQQLITSYPESNRIGAAAYQLGEIYESKTYKQYRRSALYYERCFQWNPTTQFDARLRAARLYDKVLMERGRATELYDEITTHETNPKWQQEAQARRKELNGGK